MRGEGKEQMKVVLGAFAKLRKATICFVMSVCLSAWNTSSPTRSILMKRDISDFFSKFCRENPSFIKIRQE